MDLKPRFEDYTEHQFLQFTQRILNIDGNEQTHDQHIAHFDQVCGHPHGPDLLFYPLFNNKTSPEGAVHTLKLYRKQHGLPMFKDGNKPATTQSLSAPVDRSGITIISGEVRQRTDQRLAARTGRNPAFAAHIQAAAELDDAEQQADYQLNHLETLLANNQEHPLLAPGVIADSDKVQQLQGLIADMKRASHHTQISMGHLISQKKMKVVQLEMMARFQAQRATLRPNPHARVEFEHISSILQQHLQRFNGMNQHQTRLQHAFDSWLTGAIRQQVRLESGLGMGPSQKGGIFQTTVSKASLSPQLLADTQEASAVFATVMGNIQASLPPALLRLRQEPNKARVIDVLSFSQSIGNHDRFALSIPLSLLVPNHNWDLRRLGDQEGSVPLEYRLTTGFSRQQQHRLKRVFVVNNDIQKNKRVRVRNVEWDTHRSAYSFTSQTIPPTTFIWTTGTEAMQPLSSDYPGYITSGSTVVTDIPVTDEVQSDDYVLCFPPGSGIQPLYMMLRDRRDYPGVTTRELHTTMLADNGSDGSMIIPTAIASQLEGRVFDRFHDLQAAIKQALPSEAWGTETKVVHLLAPSEGGSVYDMNNIRLRR